MGAKKHAPQTSPVITSLAALLISTTSIPSPCPSSSTPAPFSVSIVCRMSFQLVAGTFNVVGNVSQDRSRTMLSVRSLSRIPMPNQ